MDINCVAWAPDCTLIASASDDETVKLWVLEESQLWLFSADHQYGHYRRDTISGKMMVLTILRACYVSAVVHVSLKKSQVVKTSDMGSGHLGDGYSTVLKSA